MNLNGPEMKLLFDDQYAPITTRIGFLAADHRRVIDIFVAWMSDIRKRVRMEAVAPPLKDALERLLPLTTHERRRFLFVPTASQWVAYFDNGKLGTDASSVVGHMAKLLSCRSVSVTAISDEREACRPKGRRRASMVFELFEPHDTNWLNVGRSIAMMYDDKWFFELRGEQQPFEEPDN